MNIAQSTVSFKAITGYIMITLKGVTMYLPKVEGKKASYHIIKVKLYELWGGGGNKNIKRGGKKKREKSKRLTVHCFSFQLFYLFCFNNMVFPM